MTQLTTLGAMRNTSFGSMHCSLAQSLELIGDWWTPLVLRDLYLGLNRFDQFVTDLGISRNLLTDRLATLVDGGLVRRTPYQQNPVRYSYELTEAGKELVPILMALTAWGDRWATPRPASRSGSPTPRAASRRLRRSAAPSAARR